MLSDDPTPARLAPWDELPQSVVASSSGIRLEVIGASYSGSETLIRLRLSIEDKATVLAQLDATGEIGRVVPTGMTYAGDFHDGPMLSTANAVGELLVQLPAMNPPAAYDGSVKLTIQSLSVMVDTELYSLTGAWELPLRGPAPAELGDVLKLESFHVSALDVEGGQVTIAGVRSRSTTDVAMTLPAGTLMISQPVLEIDGERLAPRSFEANSGVVVASFPPTPFGTQVGLELGTLARASGPATSVVTVEVGAVLGQLEGSESPFAIPASAVSEGDAQIVLEGEQGEYNSRRWVGIVLAGNWHPENGEPVVSDALGSELDLAHVQVGYRKDASGAIEGGITNIAAFVDENTDLTRLSFVLGSQSSVDGEAHSVELRPKP